MENKKQKKKNPVKKEIIQKLKLDVGCGLNKQHGFVGMDKRELAGVDILWDAENVPYPIEAEACDIISCSHLIEHIKPEFQIDIMNEFWRLLIPGGLLFVITPYAGSFRWHQDPTHISSWNENTPLYYTPVDQHGNPSELYDVYQPSPWEMHQLRYTIHTDINVIFKKVVHDGKE